MTSFEKMMILHKISLFSLVQMVRQQRKLPKLLACYYLQLLKISGMTSCLFFCVPIDAIWC